MDKNSPDRGVETITSELMEAGGLAAYRSELNKVVERLCVIISQHVKLVPNVTELLNMIEPCGPVIVFCDMYFRLVSWEAQFTLDLVDQR